MIHSVKILLMGLFIMSIPLVPSIFAQTTLEEPDLTNIQADIDQAVTNLPHQDRITQWAERYQVEEHVITDLKNHGRGWGEISTELALAKHLTTTDPGTFPSMQDALNQIDTLRDDGAGWGKIAQKYDVKLGKLVSDGKKDFHAIQGDRDVKNQERGESVMTKKTEKIHKPTKTRIDKISRPHKLDRPERPTRPNRPSKMERPARLNKPERPGR